LRFAEAIRREPKSLRLWTPESTIAIEGMFAVKFASLSRLQLSAVFDAKGQSWFDDQLTGPLVWPGAGMLIVPTAAPPVWTDEGPPVEHGESGVIDRSPLLA